MAEHPALIEGRVAVVTGAASGIGLAAAKRFASIGLRICLADLGGNVLEQAAAEVASVAKRGPADVLMAPTDVSKLEEVQRLKDRVYETFGEVAVLMNNAGTSPGGGPWDHYERWQRVLNVNLWGVINGVQSFTHAMIDQHSPCAIVNTGSKQGITCPPGDTAYNISKAGSEGAYRGARSRIAQRRGLSDYCAPIGARIDLHRDDAPRQNHQAARLLDARAGHRHTRRRNGGRRLLYYLPR